MPVVIEFTLTTRTGHFEQALDAYLAMVHELEAEVDDARLIFIGGDGAQNLIRGVGVYDHAEVPENFSSLPFFARLIDELEPHLASAPSRRELELVNIDAVETSLPMLEAGNAALVEMTIEVKLGHLDEFLDAHGALITRFMELVPSARIVVETSQRANGLVNTFIVYDRESEAIAQGSGTLLRDFYDSVDHLLVQPPLRSELRLIHAFARP